MTNRDQVAVITVNYRTWQSTAQAVASVLESPDVAEIVIVDNASKDEGVAQLRSVFGSAPRVKIVESNTNRGYGQGCQFGAQGVTSPLILFLNSDARLSPQSIELMAAAMADPDVGVVSPIIVAEATGRREPKTSGKFPTPGLVLRSALFRPDAGPDQEVDWVAGTAMMLRIEDFWSVGGFDPRFTMYMEDVDLCRRIAATGKRARIVAGAEARHALGASWSSASAKARAGTASQLAYFSMLGATPGQLALLRAVGLARLSRALLRDARRR
jgi:N-acetylglucosaminyl-diphospho-decaprenol L-rhamnosyltransferase